MRALDVPESVLAERRRLGQDRKDEVWDGVLHMVPPGSSMHGLMIVELIVALRPIADRRGLRVCVELGLFDRTATTARANYRVPDGALARPDQLTDRGLESAELVIEVLSPDDESRDKFPFYAALGVREIWLVDPRTRATEVYSLAGQTYTPLAWVQGIVRSPLLAIELELVSGPKLRLRDGAYVADV